jgi:hypothetical protein
VKWACPASLSEVRARSAEADRSFSTARPPTRETRREREASNRLGLFRKGSLFLTKGYFLLTTLRASIRFVARVGSHRILWFFRSQAKLRKVLTKYVYVVRACIRLISAPTWLIRQDPVHLTNPAGTRRNNPRKKTVVSQIKTLEFIRRRLRPVSRIVLLEGGF